MREQWHSRVTWSAMGWLVPLAFLAFPGCDQVFTLDPPPPPEDFAIFCDIEVRAECADSAALLGAGVPLANAAVALTTREGTNIGLDYSPTADTDRGLDCPDGQPVAIFFQGAFPKGTPRCRRAPGWLENTWNDANAECRAECRRIFPLDWIDPNPVCERARASTNYPIAFQSPSPYAGACTDGGMEDPAFDPPTGDSRDPRRIPQPVSWEYASAGVLVSGPLLNTLVRTVPFTGQWDQGAASLPLISEGDGYVEFTAMEVTANQAYTDRACGLSSGVDPDTDPSLDGIDFAIRLAEGGGLIIHEGGLDVTPFMPYALGDRARVKFTDNLDGSATITYHLIPAACAGPQCEGQLLYTSTTPAAYPLRVDATLLLDWATLWDVRIVHVKKSLF